MIICVIIRCKQCQTTSIHRAVGPCPSTRRWHRSSVLLPGEASPPPSSSAGTRPGRVQPLAQKHEKQNETNRTTQRYLKYRGVANSAGKVEIFLLDLTGSLLVHLLLSSWVVLSAVFVVKVEAQALARSLFFVWSYTHARTHGILLVFYIDTVQDR